MTPFNQPPSPVTPAVPKPAAPKPATNAAAQPPHDRPWPLRVWYRIVQLGCTTIWCAVSSLRASGREHMPLRGGAILISNHLSYLDVFMLGLLLPRRLNYVARSTLFVFPLNFLIKSVGGFPIQRDGMGASGLKETLRRLKQGGVVTFFPEGTRSVTGELGELKPGLTALARKAMVPIVPTGLAGTFEAWPRGRGFQFHPVHIHYGQTITTQDIQSLSAEELTNLIRQRLLEARAEAQARLKQSQLVRS